MTRADRLTFDDTLFETMRRVLDMPVVSQTVWRFPVPLDRRALERFHLGLGRGPLARRLVRARVPGARDHWVRANLVSPLILDRPIDDLTTWIAAHAATPLSPEDGPTWALAYAPLRDGGAALSFVTSHVIADGSLKLRALEAAATGEPVPVLPSEMVRDDPAGSGPPGAATASRTIWLGDLGDAIEQAGGAVRALPGLLRGAGPVPPRAPEEARPARTDDAVPWTPPVVIVDVGLAGWHAAAEADGGSDNALLLALCAELAVSAGRATPGDTLNLASPVSTRAEDDLRSNASTGVTVPVSIGADGRVASLAAVRASAREAYVALGASDERGDPLATARALLPVLPAALIRRLAPTWPAPTVLASNLGALPVAVSAPTGVQAGSVLNRSITPPTTRGDARRTRAGLSAWWGTTAGTATLCVAGADPDAFPDVAALSRHLAQVLAARGLNGVRW